ncbi:hypothetical protein QNI16_26660 [Cytophagaceae bacterium YF14B1]|uniref:Sugar-binding protein n=1 Tax=Xanthocytophaga flava TaxID=3048013 RepID=A0AAE3QVE3_9BACT|nr:hypothetical protein [Xanthocytophaga flavus]MDJ1484108.1 hypothetical protein [Xanthocytophaga flavus]
MLKIKIISSVGLLLAFCLSAMGQLPKVKSDEYIDAKGKPRKPYKVFSENLYSSDAEKTYTYTNSFGDTVCIRNYDKKYTLIDNPMGKAIIEYTFDKSRHKIEQRYYDAKKRLFRSEGLGPAVIKYQYNEKGQLIEEQYLDENENLLEDLAFVKFVYNEAGLLAEERQYNENKTLRKYGAVVQYKYNQQKQIVEERFLDENEQLKDNVAIVQYRYTTSGLVSEVRFLTKESEPLPTGITLIQYTYDAQGKRIEKRNYDAQGKSYTDYELLLKEVQIDSTKVDK